MPGRNDFYEKYLETLNHFHARGWNVTASDWRGQAGSGRYGRHQYVGDIPDFSLWIDDIAHFYAKWIQETPGPHIVVAHSMGGHLITRALAEHRIRPDAVVLSAPMLGVSGGGLPDFLAHWLSKFMIMLGREHRRAWAVSEKPATPLTQRQTLLTHDWDRYQDEYFWLETRPELDMGPASWRWVERAYSSTRGLKKPGMLEHVTVPMLILATPDDELVDNARISRAIERLPHGEIALMKSGCAHEIFRELDVFRDEALAAVDDFLDKEVPNS